MTHRCRLCGELESLPDPWEFCENCQAFIDAKVAEEREACAKLMETPRAKLLGFDHAGEIRKRKQA